MMVMMILGKITLLQQWNIGTMTYYIQIHCLTDKVNSLSIKSVSQRLY